MRSSLANLTGKITNNGHFELEGDLTNHRIYGSGDTILQSTVTAVANGAKVDGVLDLNSKTLNMQDSSASTAMSAGALSNSGYVQLDVDMSTDTPKSDTITLTGAEIANSATLTVSSINVTNDINLRSSADKTFAYVVTSGNGSLNGLNTLVKDDEILIDSAIFADAETKTVSVSGNGIRYVFTSGTDTGTLNVTASRIDTATIQDFFAGTRGLNGYETFNYTQTSSGPQTIYVNNELVTLDSESTVKNVNFKGGSLLGDYTTDDAKTGITVSDGYTVALKDGTMSGFSTAVKVNTNGKLNLSGMTFGEADSEIGILNNVTDIENAGTVNLSDANTITTMVNDGKLINAGQLTISTISKSDNAVSKVENTGTIDIADSMSASNVDNAGDINFKGTQTSQISGTYAQTSGATNIESASALEITGKINASGGDVDNKGTFTLNSADADTVNSIAHLSNTGTFNVKSNANVTTFEQSAGNINISSAKTLGIDSITMSGGVVANSGNLNIKDGTLASGKINGEGVVNVSGNLVTAISVGNNVKVENGGTLTNTGVLEKNVEVDASGRLKSTLASINGEVTNNGYFELTGDLTKNIAGDGETILKSAEVSATNAVTVTGSININGNTLSLASDQTARTTLTVGNIIAGTSSALAIDIDMSGYDTDTISLTGALSSGTLDLASVNVTANVDIPSSKAYITKEFRYILADDFGDMLTTVSAGSQTKIDEVTNSGYLYTFSQSVNEDGSAKYGYLTVKAMSLDSVNLKDFFEGTSSFANKAVQQYDFNDGQTISMAETLITKDSSISTKAVNLNGGTLKGDFDQDATDKLGVESRAGFTVEFKDGTMKDYGTAIKVATSSSALNLNNVTFENNDLDVENYGNVTTSGTVVASNIENNGKLTNSGDLTLSGDISRAEGASGGIIVNGLDDPSADNSAIKITAQNVDASKLTNYANINVVNKLTSDSIANSGNVTAKTIDSASTSNTNASSLISVDGASKLGTTSNAGTILAKTALETDKLTNTGTVAGLLEDGEYVAGNLDLSTSQIENTGTIYAKSLTASGKIVNGKVATDGTQTAGIIKVGSLVANASDGADPIKTINNAGSILTTTGTASLDILENAGTTTFNGKLVADSVTNTDGTLNMISGADVKNIDVLSGEATNAGTLTIDNSLKVADGELTSGDMLITSAEGSGKFAMTSDDSTLEILAGNTGASLTGVDASNGVIKNSGSDTTFNGEASSTDFINIGSVNIAEDATKLHSMSNSGVVNVNADLTLAESYNQTSGNTNVANAKTLNTSSLNVNGGTVTNNSVINITAEDGASSLTVANAGTKIINGTMEITSASGTGAMVFDAGTSSIKVNSGDTTTLTGLTTTAGTIANAGNLTIDGTINGTVINNTGAGKLTVPSTSAKLKSGDITINSLDSGTGTFTVSSGKIEVVDASHSAQVTNLNAEGGSIANTGVLTIDGATASTTNVTNTGTLSTTGVSSIGNVTNSGTFNANAATTVNGRYEQSTGTSSSTIISSAGSLTVTGTMIATKGTVTNEGSLELQAGDNSIAKMDNSGNLTFTTGESEISDFTQTSGTMTVDSSSTLRLTKASMTSGTIANSGEITIGSAANNAGSFTGGSVTGDGKITVAGTFATSASIDNSIEIKRQANVTNSGSVSGDISNLGILTNNVAGTINAINNSGTFNNVGYVEGNVVNNAGAKMTSSLDRLATGTSSTVTNDGTFNMSGNIVKNIAGTGTTILQSDNVSLTTDATIDGTLKTNNAALNFGDGSSINTLTVGKLIGSDDNTRLTVDLDMSSSTPLVDKIIVRDTASGIVTLENVNITHDISTDSTVEADIAYIATEGSGSLDGLTTEVSAGVTGGGHAEVTDSTATVTSTGYKYQFSKKNPDETGVLHVTAQEIGTATLREFFAGEGDLHGVPNFSFVRSNNDDTYNIGINTILTTADTDMHTKNVFMNGGSIYSTAGERQTAIVDTDGYKVSLNKGMISGFGTAVDVKSGAELIVNSVTFDDNTLDIANKGSVSFVNDNVMSKVQNAGVITNTGNLTLDSISDLEGANSSNALLTNKDNGNLKVKTIATSGKIANESEIYASESIKAKTIENSGIIAGAIDANGAYVAGGMSLTSTGSLNNTGTILATSITSGELIQGSSAASITSMGNISTGDASISGGLVKSDAKIIASGNVEMLGGNLESADRMSINGNLTAFNSGTIATSGGKAEIGGNLEAFDGALINILHGADITGDVTEGIDSTTNYGKIAMAGNVNATANVELHHALDMSSGDNFTFATDSDKTFKQVGNVSLSGDANLIFGNTGATSSINGAVTIDSGKISATNANINGAVANAGTLAFEGGTSTISSINNASALKINAGVASVTGSFVQSSGSATVDIAGESALDLADVSMTAGLINNAGTLTVTDGSFAGGNLKGNGVLNINGDFENKIVIENNTQVLDGGVFTNAGTLTKSLTVKSGGSLDNKSGASIASVSTETGSTSTSAGNVAGAVNNAGNFINTGSITGNVTNSGTFTSSLSSIAGTISNTGAFNFNGALSKDIAGNGTAYAMDSTFTASNGVSVEGTLDAGSSYIDLTSDAIAGTQINVGKLASTSATIGIDVDMTDALNSNGILSDKINIASGGSGTLTINTVNVRRDVADLVGAQETKFKYITGDTSDLSTQVRDANNADSIVVTTGYDVADRIVTVTSGGYKYTFTQSSTGELNADMRSVGLSTLQDFFNGVAPLDDVDAFSVTDGNAIVMNEGLTTSGGMADKTVFFNGGGLTGAMLRDGADNVGVHVTDGYNVTLDSGTVQGFGTDNGFTSALTVDEGASATLNDIIFTNNATDIVNAGTITTSGEVVADAIANNGVLNNSGELTASTIAGSGSIVNGSASSDSFGASIVASDVSASDISNYADMTVTGSVVTDTLDNEGSAKIGILTSDQISNTGSLNATTIANSTSGTNIDNSGMIRADSANIAKLTNNAEGTVNIGNLSSNEIDNKGSVTATSISADKLTNKGTFNSNDAQIKELAISNGGEFNNLGTLTLASGTKLLDIAEGSLVTGDMKVDAGKITTSNTASSIKFAKDEEGKGSMTIASGSDVAIDAFNVIGGTFVNAGTASIKGSSFKSDSSTPVTNSGTLTLESGNSFDSIVNSGTVNITGADNTVTTYKQASGTTNLSGSATLTANDVDANGTINVTDSAELTVDKSITLDSSTSSLVIDGGTVTIPYVSVLNNSLESIDKDTVLTNYLTDGNLNDSTIIGKSGILNLFVPLNSDGTQQVYTYTTLSMVKNLLFAQSDENAQLRLINATLSVDSDMDVIMHADHNYYMIDESTGEEGLVDTDSLSAPDSNLRVTDTKDAAGNYDLSDKNGDFKDIKITDASGTPTVVIHGDITARGTQDEKDPSITGVIRDASNHELIANVNVVDGGKFTVGESTNDIATVANLNTISLDDGSTFAVNSSTANVNTINAGEDDIIDLKDAKANVKSLNAGDASLILDNSTLNTSQRTTQAKIGNIEIDGTSTLNTGSAGLSTKTLTGDADSVLNLESESKLSISDNADLGSILASDASITLESGADLTLSSATNASKIGTLSVGEGASTISTKSELNVNSLDASDADLTITPKSVLSIGSGDASSDSSAKSITASDAKVRLNDNATLALNADSTIGTLSLGNATKLTTDDKINLKTVDIDAGASSTIAGKADVTFSTPSKLNLGDGSTLTLGEDTTLTVTDSLNLVGSGKMVASGDLSLGELTIDSGANFETTYGNIVSAYSAGDLTLASDNGISDSAINGKDGTLTLRKITGVDSEGTATPTYTATEYSKIMSALFGGNDESAKLVFANANLTVDTDAGESLDIDEDGNVVVKDQDGNEVKIDLSDAPEQEFNPASLTQNNEDSTDVDLKNANLDVKSLTIDTPIDNSGNPTNPVNVSVKGDVTLEGGYDGNNIVNTPDGKPIVSNFDVDSGSLTVGGKDGKDRDIKVGDIAVSNGGTHNVIGESSVDPDTGETTYSTKVKYSDLTVDGESSNANISGAKIVADTMQLKNSAKINVTDADVTIGVLGEVHDTDVHDEGLDGDLVLHTKANVKVQGESATHWIIVDGDTNAETNDGTPARLTGETKLTTHAIVAQNATADIPAELKIGGNITVTGVCVMDDGMHNDFNAENMSFIVQDGATFTFGDGSANAKGKIGTLTVESGGTHTIVGPKTLNEKSKFTYNNVNIEAGGVINALNTHVEIGNLSANGGMLVVDPSYVSIYSANSGNEIGLDVAVGSGGVLNYGGMDVDDLKQAIEVMGYSPKSDGHGGITVESGTQSVFAIGSSVKINADTGRLLVDPTVTDANAASRIASLSAGDATFAEGSLFVVKAGSKLTVPGTLTVASGAMLALTGATQGKEYLVVDGYSSNATVKGWNTDKGRVNLGYLLTGQVTKVDAENARMDTEAESESESARPMLLAATTSEAAEPTSQIWITNINKSDADFRSLGMIPVNALNELTVDSDADDMGIRFLSRSGTYLVGDENIAVAMVNEVSRAAATIGIQHTALRVSDSANDAVIHHMSKGWQDLKSNTYHTSKGDLWFTPIYGNTYTSEMIVANNSVRGNFTGGAAGIDVTNPSFANSSLTVGFSVNGGAGSANSHGTATTSKDKHSFGGISAYAGWSKGKFNLIGSLAGQLGVHQAELNLPSAMQMDKFKGDADTYALSADLRAEYAIQSKIVDIMPHVGARYTALHSDGWKLKSNGKDVVKFSSNTQHIVQGNAGITISKTFRAGGWTIKPALDLAYTPAFGDRSSKTKMNFAGLTSTDTALSRVVDKQSGTGKFNLTVGNDRVTFGLGYGIQKSKHETNHTVSANFVLKF